MRKCTVCGQYKPKDMYNKSGGRRKDGTSRLRGECKDCESEKKRQWRHTVEGRSYEIARQLFRRISETDRPENRCYVGIECKIGATVSDVARYIQERFSDEIQNILDQGRIPSLDRLDSTKHYEEGNLRIIPWDEHAPLTSEKAGMVSARRVRATHMVTKEVRIFESVSEASRHYGVKRDTIYRSIKTSMPSPKLKTLFEYA